METNSQIELRLFGAFRNYSNKSSLTIELIESPSSIEQVKKRVFDHLAKQIPATKTSDELLALVSQSALANESRVLTDSDHIVTGMKLAILPPVCGG